MSVVSGEEVAVCCKSFVKINPNGVDLAPKQVSRLPMDPTIFLHGGERGYLGPGEELVTEKERSLRRTLQASTSSSGEACTS